MDATRRITALEAVPEESTFVFRVVETDGDANEVEEAILVRQAGELECWLNYCQHFTHIKLDKGTGAAMRNGEIICENHGAYFEADSGVCTFGPCEGAYLTALEVAVEDGDVYLTDEGYDLLGPGPIPTDEADRASTSNVEF
ncbi:Rieske (2Fe-2S) protein [Halostagnicola kamekurae]|uniref:Ferredoxin subunit of nitrite reductase or a ring-hydroxylating dioxygenase n=1 Tax=Halostagnicola kamekurae TaxID=619731 RepID=A0A1I6S1P3_9EURY|nr:Rieske 2Fe-2S domain-containing protein [Halostagnicola kamekurae]SFS70881.1 Ferredoxin subunit of nitrite reductase or a ring-hydroxylating dioxygenase [Halostagnicola kamekurae]